MKKEYVKMKLNLGCGYDKKEGYVNIDKIGHPDLNVDLNELPLPFKNDSVSEILMNDILEHLKRPIDFLIECHRVLNEKGVIKIRLPHYSCFRAYDPLHTTYWHAYYFKRFEQVTETGSYEQYELFNIQKCKIHFFKGKLLWNHLMEYLVNINDTTLLFYEANLAWIFPSEWIEIELEKK